MTLRPSICQADFERGDFYEKCLFTGKAVKKTKHGEHVIPGWLIRDYQLQDHRIVMGWPGGIANINMFRTRADFKANNKFGELEDPIKRGEWTTDTLHLWQKKISAGMILCHWHMAQDKYHPERPQKFDNRHLVITLNDFRADFEKFANGQPVPRNGSTLVLPTMLPDGWLAHVFGSAVMDIGKYDALQPFGMLVVTHKGKLIVSVFHDSDLTFEQSNLQNEWSTENLDTCVDAPRIAAALALKYSQFVFKEQTEGLGHQATVYDDLLKYIGAQLGLDIDPKTNTYSLRNKT